MAGSFTFLPWVRQGMISSVQTVDTLDSTLDSHIEVHVYVHLNNSATPNATKAIRLLGPGDVTGFDARQVIRTDPVHLTSDFEPNYFPVVEFDRPDFPWLFTPAANAGEKLRPWICLIAVEKRAENLQATPQRPLPVLTVIPNQELPNLSESWAWAHAQITGDDLTIDQALASRPERTLSRLLCPRKLKPNIAYYACVVPTFDVGRKAGLGEAVKDGPGEVDSKLLPAWDVNSSTEISLPVYFHWEFSTGADGDFEALAWQLHPPRDVLQGVGLGTMQVANTDPDHWPEVGLLPLESVLRLPESPQPLVNTPPEFQEVLRTQVNLTEDPTSPAVLPPGVTIAPPLYGRWHAARRTLAAGSSNPLWLMDLNLHPTYRAAASIGTQIVQDQQEHLMASAWEQVGDILRANQALRQAQLSRAAGTTIFAQHVKALPTEVLFYVTGTMHMRVLLPDNQDRTISGRTKDSILPPTVTQGSFRRLTSPRSPLSRRLQTAGGLSTGRIIRRLNDASGNGVSVVPRRRAPGGLVTMDDVFKEEKREDDRFCMITVSFIRERLRSLDRPQDRSKRAFGEAAFVHQRFMAGCEPWHPLVKQPLDLDMVTTVLISCLDPEVSIVRRFQQRIIGPDISKAADPLEPAMAAPEFPTPMYNALLALSQSYVLPGVENIPPNTITTLATNPRFIEAFMVGLNHEMGRELLWRGYPTDQRGTYFRQFWDQRGHVPAPITPQEIEVLKDIQPIAGWQGQLGENMSGKGPGSQTVLLLRGDLLRRYPRTMIYAVEAEWVKDASGKFVDPPRRNPIGLTGGTGSTGSPESYPFFQGTLPPDITFLGFGFDPAIARGDEVPSTSNKAGYFFVLQQPPTEPRYGLDETAPETLTGTWRDLSWVHIQQQHGYVQLTGLQSPSGSGDPATYPTVSPDKDITWGSNSAAMAYITLQNPFRVAIHATDLLPAGRKTI
jgi:hypothetical protein